MAQILVDHIYPLQTTSINAQKERKIENILMLAPSLELEEKDTSSRRIAALERNIAYIQEQHSQTLAGLHQEISKLQEMCSGIY